MFNVRHKNSGKIFTVYSIKDNLDTIQFLIYDNNCWQLLSADICEPLDKKISTISDDKLNDHSIIKSVDYDVNASKVPKFNSCNVTYGPNTKYYKRLNYNVNI